MTFWYRTATSGRWPGVFGPPSPLPARAMAEILRYSWRLSPKAFADAFPSKLPPLSFARSTRTLLNRMPHRFSFLRILVQDAAHWQGPATRGHGCAAKSRYFYNSVYLSCSRDCNLHRIVKNRRDLHMGHKSTTLSVGRASKNIGCHVPRGAAVASRGSRSRAYCAVASCHPSCTGMPPRFNHARVVANSHRTTASKFTKAGFFRMRSSKRTPVGLPAQSAAKRTPCPAPARSTRRDACC